MKTFSTVVTAERPNVVMDQHVGVECGVAFERFSAFFALMSVDRSDLASRITSQHQSRVAIFSIGNGQVRVGIAAFTFGRFAVRKGRNGVGQKIREICIVEGIASFVVVI